MQVAYYAPGQKEYKRSGQLARGLLACEQALRGALAAGRENEGQLANSLELEFHLGKGSGYIYLSLSMIELA